MSRGRQKTAVAAATEIDSLHRISPKNDECGSIEWNWTRFGEPKNWKERNVSAK